MTPPLQGTFPFTEGEHYRVDEDGCWIWTGPTTGGYGRTKSPRHGRAHRIGYMALHGDLPPNVHVHHHCRNRLCINPDHLSSVVAGIHVRWHQRTDKSPVTEAQVIEMREKAAAGTKYADLAAEYGIHLNTVAYIVRGERWGDVSGFKGRPDTFCRACGKPLTGARHKRYCGHRCQSAYHRQQERERAEHQCEKCHRGATAIFEGHYFCGYHCKRHWGDPKLVRLPPIYAQQRSPSRLKKQGRVAA